MALLLVGFAVRAVLRHTASAELPPSPSRVEVAPEDWRRPLFDLAAAADWGAAAAWIADRLPSLSPEQAGNLALLLGSWLDPQVEPTPPEEFRLSLAETWIGLGHFDERSLHQVAELLLRNGRALEALELLDSHLQQHPEQVQLAVVAVQAALAVRDAERAERWMTLVRQASPGLVPPELQAQLEQELTELRNLRTMESPYFVLALEESTSQERGRELLAQLDQAHAELAEKLGVEAMGKISVVLYSDPRFAGVGGAAQPAWVEASFDGKIRLPRDRKFDLSPSARLTPEAGWNGALGRQRGGAAPGRERSGSAGGFPGPVLGEGEGGLCLWGRGGDEARPRASRRIGGGGAGTQGDQGNAGAGRAAGGGARPSVTRRAEASRWSRMRRMTRPSVMKATTRITPRQRGQTRGSTS